MLKNPKEKLRDNMAMRKDLAEFKRQAARKLGARLKDRLRKPVPAKDPIADRVEARKQEFCELIFAQQRSFIYGEKSPIASRITELIRQSEEHREMLRGLLSGEDESNRSSSMAVLPDILLSQADFDMFVEPFAKALSSEDDLFRSQTAYTLERIAEEGIDIAVFVPALVKNFSHPLIDDAAVVLSTLRTVAEKGNHEAREKIVSSIMEFMNSEYFKKEAHQNSDTYLALMRYFDEIIEMVEQAEKGNWEWFRKKTESREKESQVLLGDALELIKRVAKIAKGKK